MTEMEVGSGQVYPNPIEFGLFDIDGQIMRLDSTSKISVKSQPGFSAKVLGTTTASVQGGKALFDNLIFKDEPGTPG